MRKSWIAAALGALLGAGSAVAADIEGVWRTAAGTLEVEIEPCGAAFCGTVVKVLSTHSMSDSSADLAAKPALGLVVLSNFLPAGDGTWAGFIYDREAVQTYRCNLSLDASGRLLVHGYLGWPVIGSSQIWTRAGSQSESRSGGAAAPEFAGIERWLNSEPLTLAELRGKVVLVDFWTLACGNCIATLPHVAKWDAAYRDQGLVVIGVHTPETPEEAKPEAIADAVRRFGIRYPVAEDGASATWKAYGNHFWPAVYLIDSQGRIADSWFGEGSYYAIEASIRELLSEARQ